MTEADVRKGMPPVKLPREEFERRYRSQFIDPAFAPLQRELDAIVGAAWDAYSHSRKAPRTRKAGPGFSDPDYDIAVDWLDARAKILEAQRRHDDADETRAFSSSTARPAASTPVPARCPRPGGWSSWPSLFSSRWDLQSTCSICPGSLRVRQDDLPCKSCVGTAMPLCHWPCSCYPNHSLGQTGDWMNEIYPLWVAAHGILIVDAGELVSRAVGAQGDDGPHGLRRRRQS